MRRWHPLDRQKFSWPMPSPIVLRDRDTGVLYLFSHDANGPIIVTPVPSSVHTRSEEPLLRAGDGGNVRLFVSSGVLLIEMAADRDDDTFDEPVYTFNPSDRRTTYEVTARVVRTTDDPLCLRRWSNLGMATLIVDLGCNFFLGTTESTPDSVFESDVFDANVFV